MFSYIKHWAADGIHSPVARVDFGKRSIAINREAAGVAAWPTKECLHVIRANCCQPWSVRAAALGMGNNPST